MKYVTDTTGRFKKRPHYMPSELDSECEHIITEFMRERCGKFDLPIPTDLLTKLIERDAQSLDMYADLSPEGAEVQGVTDFFLDQKPNVRIAKALTEQDWREHRLRTTLTHEYCHVRFHGYLWQLDDQSSSLFGDLNRTAPLKCKRDGILNAPTSDWMEWQAGYVCGAILMPASRLQSVISDYVRKNNLVRAVQTGSPEALELAADVAQKFDVSEEAARVRLLKLGGVKDMDVGSYLF